jgi:hypothetical protein
MVPGNETRTPITSRVSAVFGGCLNVAGQAREKRRLFDQLDYDAARELTFDFQEGRCELTAFVRGGRRGNFRRCPKSGRGRAGGRAATSGTRALCPG